MDVFPPCLILSNFPFDWSVWHLCHWGLLDQPTHSNTKYIYIYVSVFALRHRKHIYFVRVCKRVFFKKLCFFNKTKEVRLYLTLSIKCSIWHKKSAKNLVYKVRGSVIDNVMPDWELASALLWTLWIGGPGVPYWPMHIKIYAQMRVRVYWRIHIPMNRLSSAERWMRVYILRVYTQLRSCKCRWTWSCRCWPMAESNCCQHTLGRHNFATVDTALCLHRSFCSCVSECIKICLIIKWVQSSWRECTHMSAA